MRIGSSIAFLIVVLVGFGYLLADNIHMHQELRSLKQYNAQLLSDIETLQNQFGIVNTKNASLEDQILQLTESKINLEYQVQNLLGENQAYKDRNTELQTRLDQMIRLNSWLDDLTVIFQKSRELELLIPILPISLVATFVVYRQRQRRTVEKKSERTVSTRNESVKLTEKEWKRIIIMRRRR